MDYATTPTANVSCKTEKEYYLAKMTNYLSQKTTETGPRARRFILENRPKTARARARADPN